MDCYLFSFSTHAGNTEDKKVPTLVQAFASNKMVGVDCGSGDAHTLFLEDNGEHCMPHTLCHNLYAIMCFIIHYKNFCDYCVTTDAPYALYKFRKKKKRKKRKVSI